MINLFYDEYDARWEAWIDVEHDPKNGVCLGSGQSQYEALFKARLSLQHELYAVNERMRDQSDSQPKRSANPATVSGIRSLSGKIRRFKLWAKALDPYGPITKKEHDDLQSQIEWVLNRLENWPEGGGK